MSDWSEPIGSDGVVKWRFEGEFPCGYRWAVSPSREDGGVQPEEQINLIPGVHVVKADWVSDQASQAHDRLCACTFEEDGETWPGYEFDVTTVTLTKARYAELLEAEKSQRREGL